MSDHDVLILRGRLGEVQEEMSRAESAIRNAVDVIRKHIIIFATPEDIPLDCVRAAVEDLAEARESWMKLRDERIQLRRRLGME